MREPINDHDDALEIGMVADPLSSMFWPEAKAALHPALMQSDEDWPEVERDLSANDNQLWIVRHGSGILAAAVTRIAKTRGGEVVEVYLVGGADYLRWIAALHDAIEKAARSINCIGMRAYGRRGWERSLSKLGWQSKAVTYEKVL